MKPARIRPDEPLIRIKPGFDCRPEGARAPWERPLIDARNADINRIFAEAAQNVYGTQSPFAGVTLGYPPK